MVTTVFETNLSLQDARLNTVMKKLTGWAAIIAVPTAVTGFYGQNVEYPGINTVVGFVVSSVVIVVMVALLYVMFRKRDWL
jgi:magnesium transporter